MYSIISILLLYPTLIYANVASGIYLYNSSIPPHPLSTHTLLSIRQASETLCIKNPTKYPYKGCTVYYIHNHKTGGTTMCNAAIYNHMRSPGLRDNCNIPFELFDDPTLIDDYIQRKQYRFVAQEILPFIPKENLVGNLYITTIRNPLDRVLSHLHHSSCYGRMMSQMFYDYSGCSFHLYNATFSDIIFDPCMVGTNLSEVTSNYYVKMFSGCSHAYCNHDSLEYAKRMLSIMSAIIITDSQHEFARYSSVLKWKLGMNMGSNTRKGSMKDSNATRFLRDYPDTLKRLEELNSLDMEFYYFAKSLAEKQLLEAESQLKAIGEGIHQDSIFSETMRKNASYFHPHDYEVMHNVSFCHDPRQDSLHRKFQNDALTIDFMKRYKYISTSDKRKKYQFRKPAEYTRKNWNGKITV